MNNFKNKEKRDFSSKINKTEHLENNSPGENYSNLLELQRGYNNQGLTQQQYYLLNQPQRPNYPLPSSDYRYAFPQFIRRSENANRESNQQLLGQHNQTFHPPMFSNTNISSQLPKLKFDSPQRVVSPQNFNYFPVQYAYNNTMPQSIHPDQHAVIVQNPMQDVSQISESRIYQHENMKTNDNLFSETNSNVSKNSTPQDELDVKPKRVKVSYTCTECRIKRTKCDKKLPCGSCFKKNLVCKYDTKTQVKPKRPNKDSLILRLSKQLQFYKDLAVKHTPENELTFFTDDLEEIDYALGVRTLKKNNNDGSHSKDLIFSIYKDSGVSDTGFFSDEYLFKSDYYLNTFLMKPNINVTVDKLKDENKKKMSFQANGIGVASPSGNAFENKVNYENFFQQNLLGKDANLTSFQKNQTYEFVKKIHEFSKNDKAKSSSTVYSNMFNQFYFEGVTDNTIEDFVDPEKGMTPLLTKIVEIVNSELPSYNDVMDLKHFYYTHVFIDLPCICIDDLESLLKDSLFKDEKTGKAYFSLEKHNIRHKICYMAILFVIMGISSFLMNMDKTTDSKVINFMLDSDDLIFLPMKLIMSTNPIAAPTDVKIYALLSIWTNFAILPNPKFSLDLDSIIPSDLFAKFISNLAMNTGILPLHIDNEDFGFKNSIKKNKDCLINRRTFLTMMISLVVGVEDILKGHVYDFKISSKQYNSLREYIKNEGNLSNTFQSRQISTFVYNIFLRKLMVLYHLKECANFFSTGSYELNVTLLESKLNDLHQFINEEMNLASMQPPENGYPVSVCDKSFVNSNVVLNKSILSINIFQRYPLLKIYNIMILEAEDAYFLKPNDLSIEIFEKYSLLSIKLSIDSLILLKDFISGKYNSFIGSAESITIGLGATSLFSKIMAIFLQIICKIYVYKIHLQIKLVNEQSTVAHYKEEYEAIKIVFDKLSCLLFETLELYTQKYKYYYFHSFRLCLFYSSYKRIVESGKMFNHLFHTNHVYDPNAKLPDEITNHFLIKRLLHNHDFSNFLNELIDFFKEERVNGLINAYKNREASKQNDFPISEQLADNVDVTDFDFDFDFVEFMKSMSANNNTFFDYDFLFQ